MTALGSRRDRVCSQGFSLVELLVAMLLGVILSCAMVLAFVGARQSALHEEQLARIQENGRFALRLLSRELVMAGFFAALPVRDNIPAVAMGADCGTGNWVLDSAEPLALVADHAGQPAPLTTGNTALTCLDGADIVTGTDILAVKRTSGEASLEQGRVATGLPDSDTKNWYLHLESGVSQGWVQASPAELRDLAATHLTDSYWRAVTRIFYVRSYSDPDNRDDGIPTLCMESIVGNRMQSQCLVEGVEDIQLEFGIDTDADGTPNRYLVAPTVAQMQQAVTVQVHLLLRSITAIPGWRDENTYALGRKGIAASHDNFLRWTMSSTVRLRNVNLPLSGGSAS